MENSSPAQHVEIPDDNDMDKIAILLKLSNEIAQQLTGQHYTGELADLNILQSVLDSKILAADATLALQSLGMTFGQVLANDNRDYDWWMVDDVDGRDPCLRYKETDLLVFPQTLLSKRVEQGEAIDVPTLYNDLTQQLHQVQTQLGCS